MSLATNHPEKHGQQHDQHTGRPSYYLQGGGVGGGDDSRGNTWSTELGSWEPAVDGPPSSERLRQLSLQMRRASHLQRLATGAIQGHRTASSTSSSLRSIPEPEPRPAWEQDWDSRPSLFRRPSDRSTNSSTPSRERPESIFGKALFQRKAKPARDSGSSGSSYSGDAPLDAASAAAPAPALAASSGRSNGALKDILGPNLVPNLFARRKQSREDAAAVHRRINISGPFNFQHVEHKKRQQSAADAVEPAPPSTQPPVRLNRSMTADAFVQPRPVPAMTASGTASRAGNWVAKVTPGSRASAAASALPPKRPSMPMYSTFPAVDADAALARVRSDESLQSRPVNAGARRKVGRRSRSPPLPPVPPRSSSRQSATHEGEEEEPESSLMWERNPSATFVRPRPFSPVSDQDMVSPTAALFMPTTSSRTTSPGSSSDTTTWPLARATTPSSPPQPTPPSGCDKALPDVPEEDEQQQQQQVTTQEHNEGDSRLYRASMASNKSVLRASHSVPLLRSYDLYRPQSSASDTLGANESANQVDETAAQDDCQLANSSDVLSIRGNWEDDIDYAYDHEVEADCDYEWSRSSLDAAPMQQRSALTQNNRHPAADGRGGSSTGVPPLKAETGAEADSATLGNSRPSHQPSSSSSSLPPSRAMSPTPPGRISINNFSLPNRRPSRPAASDRLQPIAVGLTIDESQGFTLSPSLLIPNDYRTQGLASPFSPNFKGYQTFLENGYSSSNTTSPSPFDLPQFGHPAIQSFGIPQQEEEEEDDTACEQQQQQRLSTSTIASTSDLCSNSTGERHISANSTSTSLTRFTASTGSLNKLAGFVSEETLSPVSVSASTPAPAEPSSKATESEQPRVPQSPMDTVPELAGGASSLVPPRGKPLHKTHASESLLLRDKLSSSSKMSTAANPDHRPRVPRSRTASLNSQAPPVGQYALFPRAYVKASGDRI